MIHDNLGINEKGHLTFAGADTVDLAREYGTPLYIMDEQRIRMRCRQYVETMRECMPEGSVPLFAGKALSFKGIYRIVCSEGMYVDVVSMGEIATALAAGVEPSKLFFHGNNKTDAEIAYAIEKRVGHFIVDGFDELYAVDAAAAAAGVVQPVLLRITPDIDPHTFEAVNTGRLDCQFGVGTDKALHFLSEALECEHLSVVGLHCHVGSQVFDAQPFLDAARIMLGFLEDALTMRGFIPEMLDLGGGFGVRYTEDDPQVDIPAEIRRIAQFVRTHAQARGLFEPAILLEPGRSIVADSGMTLYTVGQVKEIEGCRNYVSVDGGMSDNPRFALYGSRYTVYPAGRMNEKADFPCTIAGRCCESGALVAENVLLPRPERGDTVAVAVTGAYNFSMASNYNRVCRPPVVMVNGGETYVAVRRETPEDLMARDM